jgi:hypothetical protein
VRKGAASVLRHVAVGEQLLAYELSFGSGRHLAISVHPDLRITARAPAGAEADRVDARIRARSGWIHRQRRRFLELHPLPHPKRFISGETHYYLGRGYRLRVRCGRPSVHRQGGLLMVVVEGAPSRRKVRKALEAWYRARAVEVLGDRLERALRLAPATLSRPKRFQVRRMTSRWGSCSPAGTVTLATDLVRSPLSCIDYVISHELCHVVEMRHSRRFYALLERLVPDWRRAQDRLNTAVR